jgi:hypothetical protein
LEKKLYFCGRFLKQVMTMGLNKLHIEPSDITISSFGEAGFYGGYEIRVEKVDTEVLCEKCIILEETFMCDYHLFLDVLDFEDMGYLTMTLKDFGKYTEGEIEQIIALEINKLIN